jgi:tetrahydromethanopterin S-methyltransferase subunit F
MLPIIRGIVFVRPCDTQRRVVELEYRSEGVAANVQLEAGCLRTRIFGPVISAAYRQLYLGGI